MMKRNMGPADKSIRLLFAAAIAVLYFMGIITGKTALVLGLLSAIFVLTSLIGFCPLYVPFGINTCKKNKS